jgi:hypothetical protein
MLKVNGKAFGKAVGLVGSLTKEIQHRLPVLGCVLVSASPSESRLAITSCDTQSFLTIEMPAKVERGFRALPISEHMKPIEKYPDDVEIIQENERTLTVKTISCSYQILTCDIDDYPALDISGDVIWSRDVLWRPEYGDIVELARKPLRGVQRPYKERALEVVALEAAPGGNLHIWATDSYVLGHIQSQGSPESDRNNEGERFFVDYQAFKSFTRAIEHIYKAQKPRVKPLPLVRVTVKKQDQDTIAILETKIGDYAVTLITRQDTPLKIDYRQVYNKPEALATAKVAANVILGFLDRLPKDAYSVKIEARGGKLRAIFVDESQQIKMEDELPAEVVGGELAYNFAVEKLFRIMNFFSDETVVISFYDGHSAQMICREGTVNPLEGKSGLIMPLAS